MKFHRLSIKNQSQISKMHEVGIIVSAILKGLKDKSQEGVTTAELNDHALESLKFFGCTSPFLGYYGYPAVLCTSVNNVVVHGIPNKETVLKAGDLLSLDFAAVKNGWCADSARSFIVPGKEESGEDYLSRKKLKDVTKASLFKGIEQCVPGKTLGDIGYAIQSYVEGFGFSVVKSFCGHGIGRHMHESPEVFNFGKPNTGLRLREGMVLAIEPMVNIGGSEIAIKEDKWTAITADGSLSAHFEHTVAITKDGPLVLTSY